MGTLLHVSCAGLNMILVLHLATPLNFKHCQVRRQTVFNDLLPDNDGVDDLLQSLDIPAQETCSQSLNVMKILEFFNLFLVTVQSAKVNLPKYRTPRDGH
jgi:hypothetical protein